VAAAHAKETLEAESRHQQIMDATSKRATELDTQVRVRSLDSNSRETPSHEQLHPLVEALEAESRHQQIMDATSKRTTELDTQVRVRE
jgi:hypothetical protein